MHKCVITKEKYDSTLAAIGFLFAENSGSEEKFNKSAIIE